MSFLTAATQHEIHDTFLIYRDPQGWVRLKVVVMV
jgi:hypothetical protein